MSERKVLTKYYPPDFDPSQLVRQKGPKKAGPKVVTVRLMAPCSMQCTSCGEYIYKGRKFNARKETPEHERYLGIQIYRFYIRCTRCSAEITFKTDPKNHDYVVERGARRNTEPWRRGLEQEIGESDEARLDRIEREMAEREAEKAGFPAPVAEERNAMADLEVKTQEAAREMAVADALDAVRSRNARLEWARKEGGLDAEGMLRGAKVSEEEDRRRREEAEDDEAARRAFAAARGEWAGLEIEEGKKVDEDDSEEGAVAAFDGITPPAAAAVPVAEPPAPTFKRQIKKKKDHSAVLGIKKKAPAP